MFHNFCQIGGVQSNYDTSKVYQRFLLPGGDVPVSSASHGDDGPVEGLGQGVEHCVGLILLEGVP